MAPGTRTWLDAEAIRQEHSAGDRCIRTADRDPATLGSLEVTLPDAVMEELAELVAERVLSRLDSTEDGWLDSTQAAGYLGLTRTALHRHTASRTIPFAQDVPGGKCWFKRSDLDRWRRGGEG